MPADIVGFANNAFGNNLIQRSGMVFNKQPVANLHPVAVHGQRFAVERVQNHQRDEFFGEVIRAVVVRAIGYDGRQAVSAQPCADEMVAGSLGSRIGAGRGVGRGFSKQIIRAVQVAIDFIGGNMVKTENFAFFRRHLLPIGASGFKQVERADDVGLDEFASGIDRAVDMTFRRQVHDGIWPVLCKHTVKFGAIANVHLLKGVARAVGYIGQRFEIARIGQFVKVDDGILGILDDMADDCRTDKARAAGNEDFHISIISLNNLIHHV